MLHKAKKARSDEFYTLRADIERELRHYQSCFKGKVVYCNCDDPSVSNFFSYFKDNFHILGLKRLIASCYKPGADDLFLAMDCQHGFYVSYDGVDSANRENERVYFYGTGDFRSRECIDLLLQSDIVVTNPPFSLFREYVSQLITYKKQFLIIGNINAITYQEIFNLIQNNKAWLGINLGRGISGFIVPDHYELYGTETHIDEYGNHIISPNNCLWLTNLPTPQRVEELALSKIYRDNESLYPRYDNYNGINVDKTQDIPMDYEGAIGVPITFLHKYNPNQFEIIKFRKGDDGRDLSINGKCPYFRILIRNRKPRRV